MNTKKIRTVVIATAVAGTLSLVGVACGSKKKGFLIAPLSRFPPPWASGGPVASAALRLGHAAALLADVPQILEEELHLLGVAEPLERVQREVGVA